MTPRDPIKVWFRDDAPTPFAWHATYGDYDLDDPIGVGRTAADAIDHLKWLAGDEGGDGE